MNTFEFANNVTVYATYNTDLHFAHIFSVCALIISVSFSSFIHLKGYNQIIN